LLKEGVSKGPWPLAGLGRARPCLLTGQCLGPLVLVSIRDHALA
jgi:hypothetical protein